MPQPPGRGFPGRRIWRPLCGFVLLALLAGCGNDGNFQRVRPSLVRDDIHDWVGVDAIAGQPTLPSHYPLTDDERELRDLAYPLLEPPYDRQQWYSLAGETGVIGSAHRGGFQRAAYANHLMGTRYRSPSARYERLADDIRNDSTRLPGFFDTAARVRDIDAKRRRSLAFITPLSAAERDNALRRVRENEGIVTLVSRTLAQRIEGYRFALERLVIATPSARAADVEHDLNRLQRRLAYYRTHRTPGVVNERSLASAR